MKPLIILYIFLFGLQQNDSLVEKKYLTNYNKAKTSYFYSLGTQNGFYELELTNKFIDSASTYLQSVVEKDKFNNYSDQLNTLKVQVNSSKEIATDNLNYIVPSYGALAGYRDDYNNIDDAQELLIEGVLENILNQSEPTIKGSIKENQQFLISNLNPYNDILLGVVNDYINANSNLYHIQNHEIYEIIGKNGFDRYKKNELNNNDYNLILKNYNIDKLYNISIINKETFIDKLSYTGVEFKLIRPNNSNLYPIRYFENFRIDKSKDFIESFVISIFLIVLVFLIVLLVFNNLSDNLKSFNKENFISDSIIISGLIISIFISVFVLRIIKPEINAFIGEFYTKFWIALAIIIPIAITFILSTLIHTKFSKFSTTDLRTLTKLIFVSFTTPLLIFNHYNYYSQIISNLKWVVICLYILFCFIFLAKYLSMVIKKFKSIDFELSTVVVLSISVLIYITINFMFAFENINILFLTSLLLPLSIKGKKSLIFIDNLNEDELQKGDKINSIENPFEYVSSGFNIFEIKTNLDSFIDNSSDLVFFLTGESQIGKTRFFKEYIKSNSVSKEYFFGDFNEFKEGSLQSYEPFFEAFCLHDNHDFRLDRNFFNDRSRTYKTFKKVADIAISSTPFDLGEIISIDDNQNLSLEEISSDLTYSLLEFSKSKTIILILDDYQWVDDESNDLLTSLINNLKNKGKLASKIKILISISDFDINLSNPNSSFKINYEKLVNTLNNRFEIKSLECKNSSEYLDYIFRKVGFEIFSNRPKLKFSENFKIHLKKVIKQNNEKLIPGYFFNYISLLQKNNLVKINGQLLHLINEPSENIRYKDSNHLILKSKYEKLDYETKQIIESAAHVGFKFDASILSNIWKKDIIQIIQFLEKIEELDLIKDESEYDNIYSFKNKNFHKWLRSNHKNDNASNYRQKIIEIQKRIISSIVDKGESYISNLEIDILKSLSYRCNMFNYVDEIKTHIIKFNLLTSLKLTQNNKLEQSTKYIINIKEYLSEINEYEIDLILKIFDFYLNESIGLELIDIEVRIKDETKNLLNEIFEILITNSNKTQRSLSVIYLLKDIYGRGLKKLTTEQINSLTLNELKILDRINSSNQYKNFILKKDELEADFYISVIEDSNNYLPLLSYRKSALKNERIELAFKINIELINIFKSKNQLNEMLVICKESLLMVANNENQINSSNEILEFKDLTKTIKSLLSDTNISLKNVKKLSEVVSKYIEVYFLKEDYKKVIKLTQLIESLMIRSRLDKLLKLIWPLAGASYFRLGEIVSAEKIYFKHFELLIEQNSSKEDFMHPIDGIIHCCQIKNNFSNFEKIKKELYEHMLYMSDKMINIEFKESKINSKSPLSEFIPKTVNTKNIPNENFEFSYEVFKILYVLAKADGEVHNSEIYDIIESVNAIQISLGYNYYSNHSTFKKIIKQINGIKTDKLIDFISLELDKISNKYDRNTLKSLYHLCVDISKADGIIAFEEQKILNLLKTKII